MDFKDIPPFTLKHLEEEGKKQDIITVRLNSEERDQLERVKRILKEPKDGTAFKAMFIYGMLHVLHDPSSAYLLKLQHTNKANSRESGNFAETLKNSDL